jgi:hypothetical protein
VSKESGVTAAVIFMIALAFPFLYNAFSSAHAAPPELTIRVEGKCVEETGWMRRNHMKLLMHSRDDAVREGVRDASRGLKGCRSCHPYRGEFCSQCHHYVGVEPECWSCHYYPGARDDIEDDHHGHQH